MTHLEACEKEEHGQHPDPCGVIGASHNVDKAVPLCGCQRGERDDDAGCPGQKKRSTAPERGGWGVRLGLCWLICCGWGGLCDAASGNDGGGQFR